PQPGTSITIDPNDGRALGNAFYYNGNVWFCHTAGGNSGRAIVYYYNVALNGYPGGTPALVQEGVLDGGPGEWTYQPSIGANALGDVGIVYTQSSSTRYPSMIGATRKAASLTFDTPVLINVLPTPRSLGATTNPAAPATTTPGVILPRRTSAYRDLAVGAGATNSALFKISTTPNFICGTPVNLTMFVKSDQDTRTNFLQLIS